MRFLARLVAAAPGLAGVGLLVAGTAVLWGLGWSLLVAGAFCLLADWRMR